MEFLALLEFLELGDGVLEFLELLGGGGFSFGMFEFSELKQSHKQLCSGILQFRGILSFFGAEPLLNVLKTTTKAGHWGGVPYIYIYIYHIYIYGTPPHWFLLCFLP